MKSNTEAPPSDSDESCWHWDDAGFDEFLKAFRDLWEHHPQSEWRQECENDEQANLQ